MSITVDKIREINTTSSNTKMTPVKDEQVFNYELQAPADSIVTKRLWSEDTKSLLFDAVQAMGIKAYTPSILRDDNTAIKNAQTHLIDLMKYYEGDRNYYYEAYTTPYKDKFGTATSGFGELTNKYLTQEKAYENLCKKLKSYTNEVRNLLNKKLGKNTFENLPSSIKEGLIDLCYNKGLGAISKNADLINAVKTKDYSTAIAHLVCVYSGKTGAPQDEDAGLYRRSLNRAILASRDLKGQELEQAKQEIEKIYKKALKCHEKNNVSTNELNKIYEQFKTGKITAAPNSAESFKIKIGEEFKGRGVWAVAQALYKSSGITGISFEEFNKEFLAINNNPSEIRIGQEVKVPFIKIKEAENNIQEIQPAQKTDVQTDVKEISEKSEANIVTAEAKDKPETPGLFERIWNGIKTFCKKAVDFCKRLFGFGKKETEPGEKLPEPKTPFERVLREGKITQEGDLQVITVDYQVKKGDSLWRISKKYDVSQEKLCSDNDIKDKNSINEGQVLKIQKLGYKVEKGDNLFRIAKKFGLTVEILKDLNNIADVDKINEGQMLEIPGFIYTVKPKDTLFKISKLVGVSVEDLKRINGLESDTISPNQKIKIVYNDSDYAVTADKKQVIYNKETNTKTEVVDMTTTANLTNRPLLQKKNKVNGEVLATRQVFNPTKKGSLSGKTIIVNAGHGYSQAGTDVGTEGRGNVEDEWLVNYDNAMRLKDRLCARGAKVIFIQGHVNIITREIRKAENKADMFISVHVNSSPNKEVMDRSQIYVNSRKTKINKESYKLANIMEKKFDSWIPKNEKISDADKYIKTDTIKDNRGREKYIKTQDYAEVKEAGYIVLKRAENHQNIPSVLWEVAFMNSKKGRERMSSPTIMNSYSDIMAQSVEEYFKA